jgi:UDP-N-acetyl-D-glucosamine/UDP-N-acetyl-D-galactosamine dehydrogenase
MKKPLTAILGLNQIGISMLHGHATEQPVLGFDFSEKRIQQLQLKNERLPKGYAQARFKIVFTHDAKQLQPCKCYCINVPQKELLPDDRQLKLVKRYTALVGTVLKKGDWVFFASGPNDQFVIDTCMPLLEQVSGMKEQKDYKVAFTGI